MEKLKVNGKKILEDIANSGKSGLATVALYLSYYGLEYLKERSGYVGPINLQAEIFSKEFGFYLGQLICILGTVTEGIEFVSNSFKIPVKLVSGKYFRK